MSRRVRGMPRPPSGAEKMSRSRPDGVSRPTPSPASAWGGGRGEGAGAAADRHLRRRDIEPGSTMTITDETDIGTATGARTLTLGYSPCPNDTFIFHALVSGLVGAEGLAFRERLEDVETL